MNLSALPTLYSVFDYHTGLFDYYEPPEQPVLPASGSFRPARGRTPETLAVLVPEGAKKVGSGSEARGVVAALPGTGNDLGGTDAGGTRWWLLAAAALGTGLWLARRRK